MKHVIATESHYSTAMDAKGLEHMEGNFNIFETRFFPSDPFIVKNGTKTIEGIFLYFKKNYTIWTIQVSIEN